ncbi:hypothetical protein [Cylindrospermum sp. FACHB-282]|uniref:hypothetical protein n=1 Tax=Cylindrospermum sp. FACHB-282 TaxID=2692794 RepID=UPI001689A186|nr:hypothetical protein [Cylindrospermum sp. FACHB-282]MBD2386443.1 hypothetical protein [Cylindrospermum sp. FACHB-282]
MQIITPAHIQLWQNLSPDSPISRKPRLMQENQSQFRVDDDDLFQILTIERKSGKTEKKLVYGTRKDLHKYYKIAKDQLPTEGAEVKLDFVEKDEPQFSAVRFLLQCRQISQMMSYTWLDDEKLQEYELKAGTDTPKKVTRTQIELVREIFNSYNIIPAVAKNFPLCWLERHPLSNDIEHETLRYNELREKLFEYEKKHPKFLTYIIKPQYLSYNTISLSLLLSGQVYYQDEHEPDKWKQLWPSILSTYEMVWEYALDISWDTFYSSRVDIAQAGYPPTPPYTKVTFGYPPKPSEFNLTQENIQIWAEAAEEVPENSKVTFGYPPKPTEFSLTQENIQIWVEEVEELPENSEEESPNRRKFPFYPERTSSGWNSKNLQYVSPPFPYIPLSTT